jgi:hypothetical protein
MGFITRRLVPRQVRRAVHPVRYARSKVTPRPVKKAARATRAITNPIGATAYAAEKAVFGPQKSRRPSNGSGGPAKNYGRCPVKHRSHEAVDRCAHCQRLNAAAELVSSGTGDQYAPWVMKAGCLMLGIVGAMCTMWIPDVGWVIALAWAFIGIALAAEWSAIATAVFVALLLWFIPVVGGWLGLALVLSTTVAILTPKKISPAQAEKNAKDHKAWMARSSAAQAMHSPGSWSRASYRNPGPDPSQPVAGRREFGLPPKTPNGQ